MSYVDFIKESVSNIKTVGTLTRSSKYLSRKMVHMSDFGKEELIVELGAGDGAITKHILNQLGTNGRLISFELNDKFIKELNKIDDPRLTVVKGDAAYLKSELEKIGVSEVRHIISALPLVAFSEELREKILDACISVLHPEGKFVQLHYSTLMKKTYDRLFSSVQVGFVMINFPPAWVYSCAV